MSGSVYIAGELGRVDPVLLESFWLVEGLRRMGFGGPHGKGNVSIVMARAGAGAEKNALFEETKKGEPCLFVRLVAPRTQTVVYNRSSWGEGECALDDEIEWTGCVGPVAWTEEEHDRICEGVARAIVNSTEEERRQLWESSKARALLPELERALHVQGFTAS